MAERLDKKISSKNGITRTKAQELIEEGRVLVNGNAIRKRAFLVSDEDLVETLPSIQEEDHYVGRGAKKLKEALNCFEIDLKNKVALDVGASTGGFTQILLEKGVAKVFAIDVGHNQLDIKLREDPRVINMEGTNIKNLDSLPEKCNLLVADLSFISLRKVLFAMQSLISVGSDMILLFKPQFELEQKNIGKKGVVKNSQIRELALDEFIDWAEKEGLEFVKKISCSIKGKEGNQEYFIHFKNRTMK